MNEFESQTGAARGTEVEELRGELQVLRMLLTVALLMLIGLSHLRGLLSFPSDGGMQQATTQARELVNEFPLAAANDFVAKLRDYAKVHADFASVVAKHPALFGQPQQQPAAVPKK